MFLSYDYLIQCLYIENGLLSLETPDPVLRLLPQYERTKISSLSVSSLVVRSRFPPISTWKRINYRRVLNSR
ncbi:hypothetical protein L1987_38843 [Smallanthus sonchifolius]|uniref:Uncharacterized protein n=1 Tax=Smallanthus sonchifolius TaxID=185202 RepID=A0ACB9HJS3_9ASTR|nr:hypothetical protein L1987_38843 [Smallanthus sonchifolius]